MISAYTVPPIYAAFVWWFSTGAVLLLVGRAGRFEILRAFLGGSMLAGSLAGLALGAGDTSVGGAYMAFTCTILLWGAQEIAFLAGWLTGPRPEPCPAGVKGRKRLLLALQAILYHEFALLACGARGAGRSGVRAVVPAAGEAECAAARNLHATGLVRRGR